MSNLSAPQFHDEKAAYAYVEARLWSNGAVCPHCGGVDRVGKLEGKTTRTGLWKCYQCRKPFTVKIGTIFEDSKVPMRLWLQAMYLIAGSKKGISSNQLHRILGVTLKTAWFMSHRIREAMSNTNMDLFGGEGGIVEVDETFIGREPGTEVRQAYHHKMKVLSLVDRKSKRARSFVINGVNAEQIGPILADNMDYEAVLMTDEHPVYRYLSCVVRGGHRTVAHKAGEYVRGEHHTNTIEGFFSIFKRGMKGVYQHCEKKHLHRYLAEFDFRYSNRSGVGVEDTERADILLAGVVGKRLTYQQTGA